MKLARYSLPDGSAGVGRVDDDRLIPLRGEVATSLTLSEILEADDPRALAESLVGPASSAIPLDSVSLLPPIDRQEVWAAGVTYKRSRSARMEESAASASCYDRVYSSPRPELFMKATPHRVSGPGQPLRIRGDSKWNVPEPELTLVVSSRKTLVGFTVGNDMSSRDIEGENPLYLPQAKVYDNCCGLGPWITLAGAMPPPSEIGIRLEIRRAGKSAFTGETSVAQMARSYENLIGWLARENSFPTGVLLLTGTGVVPPSDFTLQAGDEVSITIDGIGTLTNPIVQGSKEYEITQ